MNPQIESAAGSPVWQLAFVSFALLLIAYEMLRGWRSGLARQVARFGAIAAAYFAAFYGGKFVAPLIKPFVNLPDAVLSILGSALLAFALYALVSGLGLVAFKRTSDHQSAAVRFLSGSAGAVLGFFFGVLLMCLLVIGVRSLGAVADGDVRQRSSEAAVTHAVDMRLGVASQPVTSSAELVTLLARLKNSLEFGVIGDAVKRIDVMPERVYDDLDKLGQVASNPRSAQRLLSFPGARQLSENPRLIALHNDPAIAELVARGRFIDLLQNQKILDTFNDPVFVEQIKQFDIDAALDYALEK
jgi:uncharacterized membrane protein required for colicin V production